MSQHGTGLRSPGNDRRPGIAQAGEAMQLVDFCCSGIHGAQVHAVSNGRIPRDVAAAGGCMITVQGLHTDTHTQHWHDQLHCHQEIKDVSVECVSVEIDETHMREATYSSRHREHAR